MCAPYPLARCITSAILCIRRIPLCTPTQSGNRQRNLPFFQGIQDWPVGSSPLLGTTLFPQQDKEIRFCKGLSGVRFHTAVSHTDLAIPVPSLPSRDATTSTFGCRTSFARSRRDPADGRRIGYRHRPQQGLCVAAHQERAWGQQRLQDRAQPAASATRRIGRKLRSGRNGQVQIAVWNLAINRRSIQSLSHQTRRPSAASQAPRPAMARPSPVIRMTR